MGGERGESPKAKDLSVHEVGSGCPLAGSFLDWEPGWNPRLQEGKEKQCLVRKHALHSLPDGDPSGDPESEESQLEGSVATSFQWKVM